MVSLAALFLFWILLSSALDPAHIAVGLAAAALVSRFSSDLLIRRDERIPSPKALLPYLSYLGHLAVEIVKANIHVARLVLDPRLPIAPSIVKFKTGLKGEVAKASLGNSITLTPGTLTIDIKGDTFYVHALTREAAEEVRAWHMEKRLKEVEDAA
ncbi:MAG: hypothetical protein D6733_04920 [Methanobacteriota archaeon]|nr:MAG: hypothetical protein D6733_04920 [Euryarchaeota archaeon]